MLVILVISIALMILASYKEIIWFNILKKAKKLNQRVLNQYVWLGLIRLAWVSFGIALLLLFELSTSSIYSTLWACSVVLIIDFRFYKDVIRFLRNSEPINQNTIIFLTNEQIKEDNLEAYLIFYWAKKSKKHENP